jgi:elongation factor Ts
VPESEIESEKEILRAQALAEGKPEKIVDKMVEGRIQKYYKDVCLLEQSFVKDQDKAVKDILNEKIAEIGEKISIRRFVRYEMGEGLEKRKDDFVDEVMKQANL